MHDPLANRKPPGGEQADIDKAAQIGKQHRVEAAPAYNSEAICQYHGKHSDAAYYDSILFLFSHKQPPFRLHSFLLTLGYIFSNYSINPSVSQLLLTRLCMNRHSRD